jgi:hypothetical protein
MGNKEAGLLTNSFFFFVAFGILLKRLGLFVGSFSRFFCWGDRGSIGGIIVRILVGCYNILWGSWFFRNFVGCWVKISKML